MSKAAKLKRELVACGRKICGEGLAIGTGGNISVRDGGLIYVKASSVSMRKAKAGDYIPVDLKTGRPFVRHKRPTIELPMHLACYRARPDIGAVIHTHPVYGSIAGMTVKKLGFISYEFIACVGSETPVLDYLRCGSGELAKAVAKAIKRHNAVLLKNHGAIVVGKDLKEAFNRSLALERANQIFVMSRLLAKASFISASEARRLLGR
ncbi:MAG: class II aldolase/adducin family protein [Candidatus Omnitrophica bacterium]|nr:class II aldolase/adducin family protein [Candidatus Omnitrophota bacterium]